MNNKTNKFPKILLFDVETAPMRAYVWGRWKQNISLNETISEWYILCWSAKWLYSNTIMYDKLTSEEAINQNDKRIVTNLWKLVDEADIVIAYFRSQGINDNTIAGILGNMQAESSINPEREEVGGQGYGLVQWTPVSVLQNHCATLGLSPYNNGDVQLQVIIAEILNQSGVGEWYTSQAFIQNYYNTHLHFLPYNHYVFLILF